MPLTSILFKSNAALQACSTSHAAHVTPGARGEHVARVQKALNLLDNAGLDLDGAYGPATANAVLAYKRARRIINFSYQTSEDNIVGIMTITTMDNELNTIARPATSSRPDRCSRVGLAAG